MAVIYNLFTKEVLAVNPEPKKENVKDIVDRYSKTIDTLKNKFQNELDLHSKEVMATEIKIVSEGPVQK